MSMKITIEIKDKERVTIEDDKKKCTTPEDVYKMTRMFKYRLGASLGLSTAEIKRIKVTYND